MSEKNFKKGPHVAKNKVEKDVEIIDGVSTADERKTVILDEDLEGVEFDDKVWLYWSRNKGFIISMIVMAFAIVIGVQSWKMYQAHKVEALSTAFANASDTVALEKFAKENAGEMLAGVALLEVADAKYAKGQFADAAKDYKQVASELGANVLKGRALLGQAMSEYNLDNKKGLEALKAVQDNAGIDQVYRECAKVFFESAKGAEKKQYNIFEKGAKQIASRLFQI